MIQSFHSCVVWTMNQYGKTESWMEKFVVDLKSEISDAIGFTRNEKFLVVLYPRYLLSCDPESKESKNLDITDDSSLLSKYVECSCSLIKAEELHLKLKK